MDKIEYCAVIKLFVKESLTPNKIQSKFIKVYGKIMLKNKNKKDERCRSTPGWNEVPFAIYYVLNNRHNEIN
jgi:hypothetical protein